MSYSPPVAHLLDLAPLAGFGGDWLDYQTLGLSGADAAELLRMALDEELHKSSSQSSAFAPVHAWRALGQFGVMSALEPLLEYLDKSDDDWVLHDFPKVFALLGPAALPRLNAYLRDTKRGEMSRSSAASAMKEIAAIHPEHRPEIVQNLSAELSRWYRNDPILNGLLIGELLDLRAVEAAPLMQEAFQGDRVDLMVNGDWEDVQIELGLLEGRLTPPHRPDWWPTAPRESRPPRPLSDKSAQAKAAKSKRKQARQARKRNRRH